MKANAYAEVISRNHVQAYLSELTVQQVRLLQRDVLAALDDLTDTSRQMSVYSCFREIDGDAIDWCFQPCSLLRNHTAQMTTTVPFINVWQFTICISSLSASTIPNGLNNYAFIWTAEKRNGAPIHPRATRLDRRSGLGCQRLMIGSRRSIKALSNAQRSMTTRRHHPESLPPWYSTCASNGHSVRLTR
jgi:hypothetical protein